MDIDNLTEVSFILDKAAIDNPRYNKMQFQKYIDDTSSYTRWLVGVDDQDLDFKAMLAYKHDHADVDGCYVAEIQTFQSGHGYGKQLLEQMMLRFPRVWLFADWEGGEKLLAFYRQFEKLHEQMFLPNDGHERHVFFTDGCDVKVNKQLKLFNSID